MSTRGLSKSSTAGEGLTERIYPPSADGPAPVAIVRPKILVMDENPCPVRPAQLENTGWSNFGIKG